MPEPGITVFGLILAHEQVLSRWSFGLIDHSGDLEISHTLPENWWLEDDPFMFGAISPYFFRCKIGTLSFSGKFIKRPQTPQQSQPPSSCLYFSNWGRVFPDLYLQPSYLKKKRSFSTRVSSMKIRNSNSKLDPNQVPTGKREILTWDISGPYQSWKWAIFNHIIAMLISLVS